MSSAISSISGTTYQGGQVDPSKDQFKQDMQAIQTALQSGDLASAQDAFGKLQELQKQRESKNGGQGNGKSGGSNPMQNDMQALQTALGSGNIQDAQSAFTQLQTDMKARGGHHSHHHKQQTDNSQSSTNASVSSETATTVYA